MDIGKKTPENGSIRDEKESIIEQEADIVQSLDPDTVTDEENGAASDQPPLPFSKARLIALVLTVTGAAFLNVCIHAP